MEQKTHRYNGLESELEYFRALWSSRGDSPVTHTAELWDERADDWLSDIGGSGDEDSVVNARVLATAEYLRSRGLLDGDVVDVGCGPGLFVVEFARTARTSTGIDFSEKFVDFGRGFAYARGAENAALTRLDFLNADIEAEGLSRAFDLAFSSISPAVSGKGGLEKFMRLSRAWCCNVSVVRASDSLAERTARDVFNAEPRTRHDGVGFYSLFNLLLLSGYNPETYYYTSVHSDQNEPSPRLANKIAHALGRASEEDTQKILRYLEKTDDLTSENSFVYGSVLWNVGEVRV